MPVHLVGETIDPMTAHKRAREGELKTIFRGVYLDTGSDLDVQLREHAVRIAHYIYPAAYLCSASAIDLGPTADGRLFLSGRRNQRTRLRGLEIVQTQAPPRPSIDTAIVGDSLGEFTVTVSSPEQRMLEAFRMRSEQASALTEAMRRATADRLIAEYGSADAVADALWKLARTNDWFREGEGAERYLRGNTRPEIAVSNRAAFQLDVAWHGKSMGKLSHDGHEWRWAAAKGPNPPLIRETLPGTLPPFIESLLPEGWLAQVLNQQDQRALLRHGKRYMSNITIGADRAELTQLPADMLHGRLLHFSEDGIFTGTYNGPGRGTLDESFEAKLAQIFAAGTTPRLSGVQIKAPMFLDDKASSCLRQITPSPISSNPPARPGSSICQRSSGCVWSLATSQASPRRARPSFACPTTCRPRFWSNALTSARTIRTRGGWRSRISARSSECLRTTSIKARSNAWHAVCAVCRPTLRRISPLCLRARCLHG